MAKPASGMQLSREEVSYLERALAGLPTASASASSANDADGLLKFKYHQNPYLRVYSNVLWSGYAVARGQIAEGHQRFTAARRDGQVSAVDAVTAKAMEDAHLALEDAMAPTGTIAGFLLVLRDATVQRLWARVCETSGLPPPRFHVLLGKVGQMSADEIEAAEARELAALRRTPAPAALPERPDDDDDDDDTEEDDGHGQDPEPVSAQTGGDTAVSIAVTRRGGAETAAELVLAAAGEALRELRVKLGSGPLSVTVTIEGQRVSSQSQGQNHRDGQGGRRRRRR